MNTVTRRLFIKSAPFVAGFCKQYAQPFGQYPESSISLKKRSLSCTYYRQAHRQMQI